MSTPIPDFRLYAITSGPAFGGDYTKMADHIESLCRRGLRCLQLREKSLPARPLYQLANVLREITKSYKTLLMINDRVDIALACGADGVHCREDSLPAEIIRNIDHRLLVGRSVHDETSAGKAQREGAGFLVYGPVFKPGSKSASTPPSGTKKLETICRSAEVPVFALGGITPSNAGECLAAGAHGVACISSVMVPGDEIRALDKFEQTLGTL